MKKELVKVLVLVAVLIMGFAVWGTVSYADQNSTSGSPGTIQSTVTKGTVSATLLNVRENAGTNYKVIGKLVNGTELTIVGQNGNWYNMACNGLTGWVSTKYVTGITTVTVTVDSNNVSRGDYSLRTDSAQQAIDKGNQIVNYTKNYLGKSYKYGAAGPNAFDCSGLLYKVFGDNGISVPRSSRDYINAGAPIALNDARVGDVICFSHNGKTIGHVGIYMGNQEFIHCATSSGVIISSIYDKYWNKRIFSVRKIL